MLIQSVLKTLSLRLIIKSIVQTNAAELLQTKGSWKNIMRRKLLKKGRSDFAKSASLNLVGIIQTIHALRV